jgi:hypothetical protein
MQTHGTRARAHTHTHTHTPHTHTHTHTHKPHTWSFSRLPCSSMVRILKSMPIVVMKEVVNWSWQKFSKSQKLSKINHKKIKKINANRRDEELTEIH